jgi:hypothetical protein
VAVPLVQHGGGSAGPGTATVTATGGPGPSGAGSPPASGGTDPAAAVDGPAFVFVSEHGHEFRISGFEFLIAISLLGAAIDLYLEVAA